MVAGRPSPPETTLSSCRCASSMPRASPIRYSSMVDATTVPESAMRLSPAVATRLRASAASVVLTGSRGALGAAFVARDLLLRRQLGSSPLARRLDLRNCSALFEARVERQPRLGALLQRRGVERAALGDPACLHASSLGVLVLYQCSTF